MKQSRLGAILLLCLLSTATPPTRAQVLGELAPHHLVLASQNFLAQNSRRQSRKRPAAQAAAPASGSSKAAPSLQNDPHLQKSRQLAASGRYEDASRLLFQMSRSSIYEKESAQIKYILGLMMFQLKLNQSAAFIFYDVIRQESRANPKSRYLKQSLEKISIAADYLDSDVLLKYAIKKIDENEFPVQNRDMLYFRTGEIKMLEKAYDEAAHLFGRVKPDSSFFYKAKYKQGLAYAENKELDKAILAFEDLANATSGNVTDRNRVDALLGRARVFYQKQNWEAAIDAYREVPRDTEQWHEALFESSWAMLRSARFRMALSNFHSLHSPYYQDFYQPESLLLRAIVYLYICRYDEMEKVLDLFGHIYQPVQSAIRNTLKTVIEPMVYYKEIAKINDNFDSIKANRSPRQSFLIPFLAARQILKEGDVKRTLGYLAKIEEERRRVMAMDARWTNSSIGKYSQKILEKRIEATRGLIGKMVRRHMILIANDLRDLFEQNGFLRFEMINGRKEVVRKEIAGKNLTKAHIDEDTNRDFYVQNGYEYWPFSGEYWLDEIGNYHYVGVQACEQ